ncbi:MAG: hypothetical protein KAU50_07940 [Candidatus Marinimicrobia bacterium]|nr:hypothetical protein [Candidatus Neomarinimicrobiota bacterium]
MPTIIVSGNPEPSRDDMDVLNKLERTAAPFDLRILDHIIVGRDEYYSLAQVGLLKRG